MGRVSIITRTRGIHIGRSGWEDDGIRSVIGGFSQVSTCCSASGYVFVTTSRDKRIYLNIFRTIFVFAISLAGGSVILTARCKGHDTGEGFRAGHYISTFVHAGRGHTLRYG